MVDICASSSQVTDPILEKEYKFFFDCSEWKYNKVMIQTGGQHGHNRKCLDDKEYCDLFENSYIQLVEMIKVYCSIVEIISFTPCVEKNNLSKWDTNRNKELEKRNQIVKKISDKLELIYIDIWTPLIEEKYKYQDYIHMTDEGNRFIAEYLSNFLK